MAVLPVDAGYSASVSTGRQGVGFYVIRMVNVLFDMIEKK
jgi:hypothetical protein